MTTPQYILSLFQQHFSKSVKMFFSPGRINLLGEHIDYNDGYVLPAAIDKGIWFAIYKNNSNRVNIIAADENEEDIATFILPTIQKQEGWKNYVAAVLYILQKKKYIVEGFDCVFGGNLPQNIGLGSSAALESGLLYAINELMQLQIPTHELALLAKEAENNFIGVQCGIMDMYTSLLGKENHCLLLDCIQNQHEYIPFTSDEYQWVIIDSGVKKDDNSKWNERRNEAFEGLSFFTTINKKIKSYRYISHAIVEEFGYLLPQEIYKRASYITQEIERVKEGANYLQQNDCIAFGKLMYKSHTQLSELYEASCNEVDFLVAEAKMQFDVVGAKMMGGGFGGCTINLIHKENITSVVEQIKNAYTNVYSIEPTVHFVSLTDGAREVNPSDFY